MSVSVIPGGGFTGAVKLSCSVTGSNSGDQNIPTCSFNPATVTIANTDAAQATLTVTSTPAWTTAVGFRDARLVHGSRRAPCWPAFLSLDCQDGAAPSPMLRVLLCVVALGAVLGGTTGCGGSAAASKPSSTGTTLSTGTTPDSYTVTFRAVDTATGTVTAQNSFTISVN